MSVIFIGTGGKEKHTSLILAKLGLIRQTSFIHIYLCIKTTVDFKDNRQSSCLDVNPAPMRNILRGVDLRRDVVDMTLPKRLDRNTLIKRQ